MAREHASQETSPNEHEQTVVIDDDTDGSEHSEHSEHEDSGPERSPYPEHSKSEGSDCTEVFNEER